MPRRTIDLVAPLDLRLILGPLYRGRGDPTLRLSSVAAARATRTPDGPATLLAEVRGTRVEAEAWGPGAERVLDGLPALLGLDDDPTGFDPSLHPVVAGLVRRLSRLRLGRAGAGLEAPASAIPQQRGAGAGAGVGAAAAARLRAYPGIGPWTAAEVTLRALGDPDAVSVGDFHLRNLVAFALAGEPRGTDERMIELLGPWRGHRARVIRLLEASGIEAPRYGPRYSPPDRRGVGLGGEQRRKP